jgi:hypothetical protein
MQVTSITLPLAFDPSTYHPALDVTGVAPANLVSGEVQIFDPNLDSAYTFIMPSHGPFFATGLIVERNTGGSTYVTLVAGTDYQLCFPFLGASRALGVSIYSGIRFLFPLSAEKVRLTYQTLGGVWITGQTENAAIMLPEVRHPGAVTLEQVADYSIPFPVITTAWDRQDPTSMQAVIDEINGWVEKIQARQAARSYNAPISHVTRQDNPHSLTKAQVNLGSVTNLPPASSESAQDPANAAEYLSTRQIHAMMMDWFYSASATQQGVAKLNLGINPGDDQDSVSALTAEGFTNITSNSDSAINRAYNKGQLARQVSPFPFDYPITWRGTQYNDKASFVAAVEAFVGVTPLEYNEQNGTFWFPANTTLPDLTIIPV